MANKKFLLGILVLALVFGMAVVGCEDNDSPSSPPPPEVKPGENASNPIDRTSDTNLGTMTSPASGWRELLNSIESTKKYINLDLSACTMTGTSFNPDSTVETGKKYIVSIILPTVATSIEAGTSDSTFKSFINLKSVSGANIITIGDYSFYRDYSGNYSYGYLESVDFPKVTTVGKNAFNSTYIENVNIPLVTTIGDSAFYWCSSLKNVSFPLAENIGTSAFSSCSKLESISFPASAKLGLSNGNYSNPFANCEKITFTLSGTGSLSVIENGKALVRNSTILLAYPSASGNINMSDITALDGGVFSGCSDITGINLPQVTSIGSEAFSSCSNIQDVSFPKATSIGSSAFSYCSRLQSASFPLVTTVGYNAFGSCSNLVTITMGNTAPTLDYWVLLDATSRTVTVKIPTGATGYTPAASPFAGTSVTVSGTNTAVNWANGFRGAGWNGSNFVVSYPENYIKQNITLIIQQQ